MSPDFLYQIIPDILFDIVGEVQSTEVVLFGCLFFSETKSQKPLTLNDLGEVTLKQRTNTSAHK